jgi:hypothetical protein
VTKDLILSVSRKQLYEKCPLSYKKRYIDKEWERPAAWLVQGLAVHEAAEEWQKSAGNLPVDFAVKTCEEAYDKHGTRLLQDAPNPAWWFWSGPYGGEADLERRYEIARGMIVRYIDWCESHPNEKVWTTPDGEEAIELGFNIELEDNVKIRGFIDLVIQDEHGLVVRDIKTGNKPGDEFRALRRGDSSWGLLDGQDRKADTPNFHRRVYVYRSTCYIQEVERRHRSCDVGARGDEATRRGCLRPHSWVRAQAW